MVNNIYIYTSQQKFILIIYLELYIVECHNKMCESSYTHTNWKYENDKTILQSRSLSIL